MSYYRWDLETSIPLFLEIANSNGVGVTGSDPHVAIRRYSTDNGVLLDNYYWNGTGFTVTPTSASMTQVDATNYPGLYTYFFSQSLVQSGTLYNVYFKHNSTPVGFSTERHVFLSGADGSTVTVRLYESEVD